MRGDNIYIYTDREALREREGMLSTPVTELDLMEANASSHH